MGKDADLETVSTNILPRPVEGTHISNIVGILLELGQLFWVDDGHLDRDGWIVYKYGKALPCKGL